jgi:hypothetical protein
LPEEDREAVQLVEGDGENGCAKGSFCVVVDPNHESSSENFQTLQSLANDHSATARIDVLQENDTYEILSLKSWSPDTGSVWKKQALTLGPKSSSFEGYTFFQNWGKEEPGVVFSAGNFTLVVVHGSQTALEITVAMHHELRHVFLGDFGRTPQKAFHTTPGVDDATKRAEDEAKKNATKRE